MVGGMEGLERCPRKRPVPEPAIARRASVPQGEVGADSMLAGVAEEPCPAGAEAVRRVAAEEVLIVGPVSDIVVLLGGARGCTMGESDSQGRSGCRTREWAWQSVLCCSTVSRLRTCSNVCVVAGEFFVSVNGFVWGTGPDVGGASFESITWKTFSLRSRVVVYDAGTVMCVELPRWLVGVRSAKAVCEGGVCD